MLIPEDQPVRGLVDRDGRLVSADDALAALHARAGGEEGGPLAIPQLAALARLSRRLSIPVSRAVLAADGEEDLDLWVRARPDPDGIALAIAGWTSRAAAPPLPEPEPRAREQDFVRVDADWVWEADATLRLTALSAQGMAALLANGAGPALGDALTRIFLLEEADEGGLPLLDAFALARSFDNQFVTLRGTDRRFRLAGAPVLDFAGKVGGFRGSGYALDLDPPIIVEIVPTPSAPTPEPRDPGAFTRRLDSALRAPINRIVASAEQIREQDEGPVRADYNGYASDIANAGRHLLGLIDDLVDLEAVERDDIAVEQEPIDLADVARRAAGLLSVRADDKDMRIEMPDIAEGLPATGDFKRALQVLVNLIGNGVRYGPQGSTVRVAVEPRGGFAAIVVADQGRGIAPGDAERVFEKFERLGAREPGTGLGLYISRRLARAMGGDVRIESGAGEGARFVFTLPAG
jgi:signal transduction histidine kinase